MAGKNKSKSKKLFIGIIGLVAVLVVVLALNLSSATKALIETVGSETLQTDVKIASLDISIANQSVELAGLKIKNPEGFKEKQLLNVDKIRVAAADLTGDTIVIDEVTVQGMEVTYELAGTGSNLGKIKDNLKSGGSSQSSTTAEKSGPSKNVVIRRLNIEDAKLIPALSVAGEGASAPVSLPAIRLTNIGSESRPTPPAQAITRVLNEIIRVSVTTASREGIAKSLGSLGTAGGSAKEIGDKAGEALKGLFK